LAALEYRIAWSSLVKPGDDKYGALNLQAPPLYQHERDVR
jgi:hypothetical protein